VVRSEGKMEGVVPKLFAHLVVAQTILDMKLEMQKKHPMFSGFFFQTLRWCRGVLIHHALQNPGVLIKGT